jgi:hypothetical protein
MEEIIKHILYGGKSLKITAWKKVIKHILYGEEPLNTYCMEESH